jgi:hypothetical protein
MYNKGPLNVRTSNSTKVNATELYSTFINDSVSARKKYEGKVLEIRGEVGEVNTNTQQQVILLKTGSEGAYINCTFEEPVSGIKTGDNISIKGICNGIGQADADLGIQADVYITPSLISN